MQEYKPPDATHIKKCHIVWDTSLPVIPNHCFGSHECSLGHFSGAPFKNQTQCHLGIKLYKLQNSMNRGRLYQVGVNAVCSSHFQSFPANVPYTYIACFDQHLGATHPKRWSKSSFSAYFVLFRPAFGVRSTQTLVIIYKRKVVDLKFFRGVFNQTLAIYGLYGTYTYLYSHMLTYQCTSQLCTYMNPVSPPPMHILLFQQWALCDF